MIMRELIWRWGMIPGQFMSASRPHPLSAAERVARNRGITTARAAGDTWAVIAKRFDLSERQARRAAAEHLRDEGRRLGSDEPSRIVEETLGVYTWAAEALAKLAEHSDDTSATVAAIRSRVDVAERRINLLAHVGRLPPSHREWRALTDINALAKQFLDLAERHDLPPELQEIAPSPGLAVGIGDTR